MHAAEIDSIQFSPGIVTDPPSDYVRARVDFKRIRQKMVRKATKTHDLFDFVDFARGPRCIKG